MTARAAIESELEIAPDHPAFAGHFPGTPILPGVVLLAEALACLEAATGIPAWRWSVESVKFIHAVAPATLLTLTQRFEESGRVRFEMRAGERQVASGVLAPGAAPERP